ncbi:MAG: acetyl-CoA carboxylase biotin carboxyl carrier protein subunit [Deltaproteobacteria bacterium]|nr:acetyl-CoA carboxylase biotin carboxyl carrier protein subunit [Deltaproteobacteria bacterium]
MAWEVTLGDRARRMEVEEIEGGYRVIVDGEPVEVHASFPQAGVLRMVHGARSYSVDVRATADGQEAVLGGVRYDVGVIDERDKALRALTGGAGGAGAGEVISTSMPGKVVTLLVEVGEAVEAGQGCIVIEAMKMENELRAAHAGVVQSIPVAVGEAVEGGAELVIIAPPSEE